MAEKPADIVTMQDLLLKLHRLQDQAAHHHSQELHYQSQLSTLSSQIDHLNLTLNTYSARLDDAILKNSALETDLEDAKAAFHQSHSQNLIFQKKLQEARRRCADLTHINTNLEDRLEASDQERFKLNEKWLKAVAKQKVDEKATKREREGDIKKELVGKELETIRKKNSFFEKENKYLKEQIVELEKKVALKMEIAGEDRRMREEIEMLKEKDELHQREMAKLEKKYQEMMSENK